MRRKEEQRQPRQTLIKGGLHHPQVNFLPNAFFTDDRKLGVLCQEAAVSTQDQESQTNERAQKRQAHEGAHEHQDTEACNCVQHDTAAPKNGPSNRTTETGLSSRSPDRIVAYVAICHVGCLVPPHLFANSEVEKPRTRGHKDATPFPSSLEAQGREVRAGCVCARLTSDRWPEYITPEPGETSTNTSNYRTRFTVPTQAPRDGMHIKGLGGGNIFHFAASPIRLS